MSNPARWPVPPQARPEVEALADAVARATLAGYPPICRHDPDLWTSELPTERAEAAERCRDCCPLPWGVWGGVDREALTKDRRRTTATRRKTA